MQTTQFITEPQLDDVIDAVYAAGSPVVMEAYSDYDAEPKSFVSSEELRKHVTYIPEQATFFHYAIRYPEAKGTVVERRIELKPAACDGHTFRFVQEGWGLVHLQINFRTHPRIECRIAVNSIARAGNWSDAYPHLKSPDLWDWKVVNRHAGRLVRLLKKLGKEAEQTSPAPFEGKLKRL